MRGERRVDRVRVLQHAPGAGDPAHIGRGLAGEHRIVGVALHLRELDLRVPIRALHQPRRDAMSGAPRQRGDPVDQRQRALLIRLDRQPEPIPSGKPRIGQHGGEDVEADLQPVGFLGVHRQADIRLLRRQRQTGKRTDQCRHAIAAPATARSADAARTASPICRAASAAAGSRRIAMLRYACR